MKIVATIEARMTSKRLPGKVLLEAAGKPMLQYLIDRLRKISILNSIVLATTVNATDDVLVKLAENNGIHYFRGSEEDVMFRVIGAARSVKADIIVQLTGDNCLIDHGIIEQCIRMFLNNQCDYLSNSIQRSYPIGMDTQVYRLSILEKAAAMTDDPWDREHVSLYIRNHPELFKQIHLIAPSQIFWPDLRLTLDEESDYELFKKIITHFATINPFFSCEDVVQLLRENPDWVRINAKVKQTGLTK